MKTISELQEQLNQVQKDLDGMKIESLQVGKWYKSLNCLFNHQDNAESYGFNNSVWQTGWLTSEADPTDKRWSPKDATESEVGEALIKEAERRGFKKGVRFTNVGLYGFSDNINIVQSGEITFDYAGLSTIGGNYFFYKGKWAEIIKEENLGCFKIDLTKYIAENTIKLNNSLKLIHEVDLNGLDWYWSELNGKRVTSFRFELEEAKEDFVDFAPIVPKKEVIESRNV